MRRPDSRTTGSSTWWSPQCGRPPAPISDGVEAALSPHRPRRVGGRDPRHGRRHGERRPAASWSVTGRAAPRSRSRRPPGSASPPRTTVSGPVYPTAAELGRRRLRSRRLRPGDAVGSFARLREEAPVCWHEEPAVGDWPAGHGILGGHPLGGHPGGGAGPELVLVRLGATQLRDPAPEDLGFWQEMLLNTDPPEHTRLRRSSASPSPARRSPGRNPSSGSGPGASSTR